jgi:8-oxo-dGTP pyrophosphatase MutT (NUDIX family)
VKAPSHSGRVAPDAPVEALEPWVRSRLYPLSEETGRPAIVDLFIGNAAPEGPFTPAAVLVPLIEREEGLSVLLTRRADTLRKHSGQIALPGGRLDAGETAWEAALREAEEEVGLGREFVRLVGLGDTYLTGTGFSITPVVGFVRPGFVLTTHEAEVAEVFETPCPFLMDPANHERRERDFGDGRTRGFYAMPHEDRLIWGATAGILRSLYERLFMED